jgi:hypothetical protein
MMFRIHLPFAAHLLGLRLGRAAGAAGISQATLYDLDAPHYMSLHSPVPGASIPFLGNCSSSAVA